MTLRVTAGKPYPLGATADARGTNFAVYSEHAEWVDVCLFDEEGHEERVRLFERTAHVWHGHVLGVKPGQHYGLRVGGPFEPDRGLWFNPHKLLVDPYARALAGKVKHDSRVLGSSRGEPRRPDPRDSAPCMPKCIVESDSFDWGDDVSPATPWSETIIYEMHIKGFTREHPEVPLPWRGTYLGLASEAALMHLKRLGVTAVELLPVQEAGDEYELAARQMTNYWGYSTLAFFAPDQRFAAAPGQQVREFRHMVKCLHRAGIEVILDVVYNHTCEGGPLGPCLSLRGLDNPTYYRLKSADLSQYEDFTGCGNTLNLNHPQTLALVMDSLRYWVNEMHVDGFRFDLAPALARGPGGVDKRSAFFDIIHQDPTLSRVKLIAEPWDLGDDGYQIGNFPVLWTEWNGRFRDTVRRFWRGERVVVADLGYRLTGSSDLYGDDGRKPHASINFVTAHDGFCLKDLVSYDHKHNEENGENNRDGTVDNLSWNCGVEGETDDVFVREVRARQQRNLFTTLVLAQGVPMLTMGDEWGRTQLGNNNLYCHDDARAWLDWRRVDDSLCAFVSHLIALRKRHPVFRRRSFFKGQAIGGSKFKDIVWFRADGQEMGEADWITPSRAFVALFLSGDALELTSEDGKPIVDDTFILVLNGSHDAVSFSLPDAHWGETWAVAVDTRMHPTSTEILHASEQIDVAPHALVVMRRLSPIRGSWRPFRASGSLSPGPG